MRERRGAKATDFDFSFAERFVTSLNTGEMASDGIAAVPRYCFSNILASALPIAECAPYPTQRLEWRPASRAANSASLLIEFGQFRL
jgi:hypothetical protein